MEEVNALRSFQKCHPKKSIQKKEKDWEKICVATAAALEEGNALRSFQKLDPTSENFQI